MEKHPNKIIITKPIANAIANKTQIKSRTKINNTPINATNQISNINPKKTETKISNSPLKITNKITNKIPIKTVTKISNPPIIFNKQTLNNNKVVEINISTITNHNNKKTIVQKKIINSDKKIPIKPITNKQSNIPFSKVNKDQLSTIKRLEIKITDQNYKQPEKSYFYTEYVLKTKLETKREPIGNFSLPKLEGDNVKIITHKYKNKNLGDIITKEDSGGGFGGCDGWSYCYNEYLIPYGINLEILKMKKFPDSIECDKIVFEEPFLKQAVVYYLSSDYYSCSKDDYTITDYKIVFKHFPDYKKNIDYSYNGNSNINTYVYHIDSFKNNMGTLKSLTCYYSANFKFLILFYLKILKDRKTSSLNDINDTSNKNSEDLEIIKTFDLLETSPKIILSQIFKFLPNNSDWPWTLY